MSVFIIAEAGVNHNGSIDLAKKLIDVATSSGADAGSSDREAITKELDNEISGVSNYEPNIEEVLEKEVDKVIKKM